VFAQRQARILERLQDTERLIEFEQDGTRNRIVRPVIRAHAEESVRRV
jgi:hypothetical protein